MEEQGKIPFITAVLMNINVIVGVGVYMYPQMMAQYTGTYSFLSWIAAGILLSPIVWTVATAARLFPGTGGFYNYGSSGISPVFGFLAVWSYLLGFLATAANQLAFFKVMAGQGGISWLNENFVLANLALVVIIALLNLFNVELISKIQGFATVLKLLPMISVIILFAFYWNSSLVFDSANIGNIGLTLPMAIFGYWGFESCTSTSHLIKGGPTRASAVMLTAFGITVALYTLFHFGVTHIMGIEGIALHGAAGFTKFLGLNAQLTSILGGAVIGALMLALFNAAYGVTLGNIANMFSLADKNHLVGSTCLTKRNNAGRPYLIVLIQGVIVFLLMTFVASIEVLTVFSNFGLILALLCTIAAVINTQRKQQNCTLSLIIPTVAIAACGVLAFFSWQSIGATDAQRLINAIPFIGALVLGLGMFYWKKGCTKSC